MNKKCPRCNLNNQIDSKSCVRCSQDLREVSSESGNSAGRPVGYSIIRRAAICLLVSLLTVAGFFVSLLLSSKPLSGKQKAQVDRAIEILDDAGFSEEVYYLRNYAFFRSDDHWLNALVPKEDAYAATNYPFEIMTIYQEFFTYTEDDVERAAIMLHESRHLLGKDEQDAYEYVWKNKSRLGWTRKKYSDSVVWMNVRKQTKELAPGLFICEFNQFGDCFE